jgi:hypothetical protein
LISGGVLSFLILRFFFALLLGLPLFVPFVVLVVLLLLDDIFKLLFGFWSSRCA